MPAELASIAAAVTAGYKATNLDRGASHAPVSARWTVTLEKWLTGENSSGFMFRAAGQGATQGDAETQALAALNKQRDHRFGGSPGRGDADANSAAPRAGALTTDVT